MRSRSILFFFIAFLLGGVLSSNAGGVSSAEVTLTPSVLFKGSSQFVNIVMEGTGLPQDLEAGEI